MMKSFCFISSFMTLRGWSTVESRSSVRPGHRSITSDKCCWMFWRGGALEQCTPPGVGVHTPPPTPSGAKGQRPWGFYCGQQVLNQAILNWEIQLVIITVYLELKSGWRHHNLTHLTWGGTLLIRSRALSNFFSCSSSDIPSTFN